MKAILGVVSFAFLPCAVGACGVLQSGATEEEPAVGEVTEAASTEGLCWRRTTLRGVGTLPTECPGGEKSGVLCYPRCAEGYAGVGPVCWQSCPEGYKDDGALCRRDAQILSADNSGCPWYDKCGLTLAKGCSKCPAGMTNDGCTCRRDVHIFAKATQTRGVGTPMRCGEGQDSDAGLCYARCPAGGRGVGPVCWAGCGGDAPIECGSGCARTSDACANATTDQVLSTTEAVASLLDKGWRSALEKGIAAANKFNVPLCGER
jgi:hypothetical protein